MGDEGATNYTVQPGVNRDYPSIGRPMDPSDHPASNMPTATEHYDGYEHMEGNHLDYAPKSGRDMIQDRLNARS